MVISTEIMFTIAACFLALSMAIIAIVARSSLGQSRRMNQRLAGHGGAYTGSHGKRKKGPSANMIAKFGQHITLPDAQEISRLRFILSQAGFYSVKSIPVYYAIRVAALFIPQFIFLFWWSVYGGNMSAKSLGIVAVGLVFVGLFVPGFFLRVKTKRRRQSAKDGYPDFMDLLVSCLEAGLGIDASLNSVSIELSRRYPVLKTNLDLLNLEIMTGRSRNEAFKNFAERLGLPEARALATMLRQSDEMGSSLGATLRVFSDEMRDKRMLLAEEKAMALSAKLTVPLILFIFPTLMVLLLLPAGVMLVEQFGAVGP